MFQFAIRRKVSYFILAASVVLLLTAPIISTPVFASDCGNTTSGSCGG